MPDLLGDVVVCPKVAAGERRRDGVGYDDELALLVVHGTLHLLGWDHEAPTRPTAWRRASATCCGRTGRRRGRGGDRTSRRSARATQHARVIIVLLLAARGSSRSPRRASCGPRRSRRARCEERPRKGARRLERLVEHPEGFLNPVLLLVLVCQLVAATLVGVLAARWFHSIGIVIATVFEVVVVFVVFEAIPKNYAVRHPDRAALFAAPVVYAVTRFPPVRWLSSMLVGPRGRAHGRQGPGPPAVTEFELLAMADVAHTDEAIEATEREFIHSVIEFGDTVVREVMVPRPDMVTVGADESVTSALERGLAAGFSRLPVVGEDIDDVLGIAFTKDLVGRRAVRRRRATASSSAMRPAKFVPETKRVATLLAEMQSENVHLAVVVDEYGGTAGLVTLEDVLEELVGDIRDEFDIEEPDVTEHADGFVVVSGRMSIDEVDELLDDATAEGVAGTPSGGLAYDLAGGVPEEGQVLELEPLPVHRRACRGPANPARPHRAARPSELVDAT